MSNFSQSRPGGGRPPYGQAHGNAPQGQSDPKINDYWPSYLGLEGGYFDKEGNLRVEFVARYFEGNEKAGVEPLVRTMANGPPKLTTGQLRRFFQHCRGIEAMLKSGETPWPRVRPSFEFLAAAAADAYGKQPRKIPALFYEFITRNVAAVKTERDFLRGFLPHFEALVGFGSLYLQKERN